MSFVGRAGPRVRGFALSRVCAWKQGKCLYAMEQGEFVSGLTPRVKCFRLSLVMVVLRFLMCGLLVLGTASCGGSQKKAKSGDKLVPEETQKKSRERMGSQQMMMDDLNMTPAERAAARHDNATQPVENPKYSEEEKKKE